MNEHAQDIADSADQCFPNCGSWAPGGP